MATIKLREWAASKGITMAQAAGLSRKGLPTVDGISVDPDQADAWYAKHMGSAAPSTPAAPGTTAPIVVPEIESFESVLGLAIEEEVSSESVAAAGQPPSMGDVIEHGQAVQALLDMGVPPVTPRAVAEAPTAAPEAPRKASATRTVATTPKVPRGAICGLTLDLGNARVIPKSELEHFDGAIHWLTMDDLRRIVHFAARISFQTLLAAVALESTAETKRVEGAAGHSDVTRPTEVKVGVSQG